MQFKIFLNDFFLVHALYVLSAKVLLGGKNGIYVKALLIIPCFTVEILADSVYSNKAAFTHFQ
jgi:hypothetical protein